MSDDSRIHAPANARALGGEFVLYWMQGVALRARNNAALNFAVEQANDLRLPVLVYQGLRPDYPWASDRIHTFILESVVDLENEFAERGIQYTFFLDKESRENGAGPAVSGKREPWRDSGRAAGPVSTTPVRGSRSPHTAHRSPLVQLASRAALVVTDYYPTFILPRQTLRLGEKIAVPVIAVESSTVVPMRYFDRQFSSARAFRPRVLEAAEHYLHRMVDPEPIVRRKVDAGFAVTTVGAEGPSPLAAVCPIDHSVPPSATIRGGSKAARQRLLEFCATGLRDYSEGRNDPNKDVTSRLSPCLHFGNISSTEILLAAREAAPPAEYARFQDEILVWRELAHNFVYHDRRHRTSAAIPAWARKELDDHSADPRPARYSAAQLAEARTADPLWNACQRAYLRDGFMHNYLRMLWGKSVLLWTRDCSSALRILEHLNNKYSLDGRDPNTYAGIHWCLGKSDRPFYRRPIFGTVRYMSLKAAAGKFDVPEYLRKYGA
jgi:deoxyribodipyrimidine photo-lyase